MRNKAVTIESSVKAKKDFPSVDLGDEIALLNIENGRYYGLGVQGSFIWTLMQNNISIKELVSELVKKYEVDANMCEVQTIRFVNSLSDENLCDIF